MMMKIWLTLTLLGLLTACNQTNSSIYAVLNVEKGDRISIGYDKEQKIVRLCGAIVPDDRQTEAKKLISNLIKENGSLVKVVFVGSAAEIFAITDNPDEEKMLSAELLIRGLAKFNPQDNCPNSIVLKGLEEQAKQERLGIWNQ